MAHTQINLFKSIKRLDNYYIIVVSSTKRYLATWQIHPNKRIKDEIARKSDFFQ